MKNKKTFLLIALVVTTILVAVALFVRPSPQQATEPGEGMPSSEDSAPEATPDASNDASDDADAEAEDEEGVHDVEIEEQEVVPSDGSST